ncbi:sphingosine-1-phosphate lyase [Dermatophagoides farinae]|uniref:sphinganine-1-phosphate aldolase n=2 Tax=Dermatophagoides farinae TaxID=6954 RepID=A0A9D4P5E6_DERFA|nr:sphingosine-1-phosphate lyase-like [Dermatophagoides farinae]KAH7644323.1 sphingosine-1-phosphate lyase-like protein [Dermatophagoides farinae]
MDSMLNYTVVKEFLYEAETHLESYSRVQILFTTLTTCFMLFKFYRFYEDHDFTWSAISTVLFRLFIRLPYISNLVDKEMKKADKTIVEKCREIYCNEKFLTNLPTKGMNSDKIFEEFKRYQKLSKIDYQGGRVSGAVYSSMSQEVIDLVTKVYRETAFTNPLHPEVFPGITKMEAEIIRMVINLYHGDKNCCGSVTSGGTESIVLAIKAYRDYARDIRGVRKPELVAPQTAHAAFQKACHYFCIKYRSIPVDPITCKANVKAMERAVNRNTILIVGSACGYPHGVIDDIQSLAKVARKYNIPLHVDCCLGGFLVPFVKDAGFDIEPVDFAVPGVTSISCDTHKYGFTPKGSSLIMYSDKKYQQYQYSVQTDWPGGIYVSPTIAGSRCGGNIATCWASLLYYGYSGYVESTRKILTVQRKMMKELEKIDGIYIMGEPKLSVIAMGSKRFDIFRLTDILTKKGWIINSLQFPSAFHICITMRHVIDGVADDFIRDVRESVAICMKDPDQKPSGAGVIYGMAQQIPDRSMVSDMACQYIHSIYDTSDS